jgi:uncharacterized membrane protein YphA (DoxX/SURF4 family)
LRHGRRHPDPETVACGLARIPPNDGPIEAAARSFLQVLVDKHAQGWFALVIVLGELLVGYALIVGALVRIADFFGSS